MSNPARNSGTTRSLARDTPTLSINSPAMETLLYILRNTAADELHKRLMGAVSTRGPEFADQLLTNFQDAGVATPMMMACFEDRTRRHCARCHKSYNEKNNHLKACQIHHQRAEIQDLLISKGSTGYETQSMVTHPTAAPTTMTVNNVEGQGWGTISTPPGKTV